jgi:hypothetical protein
MEGGKGHDGGEETLLILNEPIIDNIEVQWAKLDGWQVEWSEENIMMLMTGSTISYLCTCVTQVVLMISEGHWQLDQ